MSWEDNQLNKHLDEQVLQQERWEAIEAKTLEIRNTLLSVSRVNEKAFVIDANGHIIDMDDFTNDMEVVPGHFAEFLDGGELLKQHMNAQLDVFCENIATGLIDK